jgi:hypothetical protein
MKRLLLPIAACALYAALAPAHAQDGHLHDDAPLYEGVWNVKFTDKRAARFELKDWNGTWSETGALQPVAPACRGRKLPVTIQHSNAREFEFTVWGSTASKDCPDTSFTFKPRDARTLEAQMPSGVRVTMTRAARR